jgi:hypothetical protein
MSYKVIFRQESITENGQGVIATIGAPGAVALAGLYAQGYFFGEQA